MFLNKYATCKTSIELCSFVSAGLEKCLKAQVCFLKKTLEGVEAFCLRGSQHLLFLKPATHEVFRATFQGVFDAQKIVDYSVNGG